VSEPSDGDGSGKPSTEGKLDPAKAKPDEAEQAKEGSAKVRGDLDVPATRKQGAVKLTDAEREAQKGDDPGGEPPKRPSSFELDAPLTFPDDGPISAGIRRLDKQIGMAEQAVLVGLLVAIVLFAGGNAILDRLAGIRIHLKDEIIRGGTFAIALLGAAFATQQTRHLAMDLVSRRLSPRARLFMKVILSVFIVFIVALMVRAGYHTVQIQKTSEYVLFTPKVIAWMIPFGGCLIILHTIFHIIIDVDYIARRKTPPERMRSGH